VGDVGAARAARRGGPAEEARGRLPDQLVAQFGFADQDQVPGLQPRLELLLIVQIRVEAIALDKCHRRSPCEEGRRSDPKHPHGPGTSLLTQSIRIRVDPVRAWLLAT
jgi:hypothetical protein